MIRIEPIQRTYIMAHFDIDAFRSYVIAAAASLYCSVMFIAATGANASSLGHLIV
jgi:hypothetical protein